ncbi:MAG: LuxR C-terminal-related transcriptional regulator [Cyanobacteriota bacterium]|nr:LuxR C-terminal-related transcriptional regulator [Cyanobacteriota bacterium]
MLNSLHALFQELATAPTEEILRFRFMDNASPYFGVQRWGIYLLDAEKGLASVDAEGVSDNFIERYQKYGQSVDPVMKYVVRYHAPAHEELVLPQGAWKQSELYQKCCSEYNHEHIMTGPIVGQGQLIGTINFARVGDNVPAFSQLDLAALGAVCTHFSARLAELRKPSLKSHSPALQRLTPREVQIAKLVAKGLTNAEIGAELWITQNSVKQALKRMFRKLAVSSRTEMVVKLQDISFAMNNE